MPLFKNLNNISEKYNSLHNFIMKILKNNEVILDPQQASKAL